MILYPPNPDGASLFNVFFIYFFLHVSEFLHYLLYQQKTGQPKILKNMMLLKYILIGLSLQMKANLLQQMI